MAKKKDQRKGLLREEVARCILRRFPILYSYLCFHGAPGELHVGEGRDKSLSLEGPLGGLRNPNGLASLS